MTSLASFQTVFRKACFPKIVTHDNPHSFSQFLCTILHQCLNMSSSSVGTPCFQIMHQFSLTLSLSLYCWFTFPQEIWSCEFVFFRSYEIWSQNIYFLFSDCRKCTEKHFTSWEFKKGRHIGDSNQWDPRAINRSIERKSIVSSKKSFQTSSS